MQIVHESKPVIPRDRLIRLPQVESLVGCKKSTLYEWEKTDPTFPKKIRLGARMVVWSEHAILSWVQNRINAEATQRQQALVGKHSELSAKPNEESALVKTRATQ